MRTTMDLPEDLLEEAKSLSGSKMIRIDNIQRLYIMLFKEV